VTRPDLSHGELPLFAYRPPVVAPKASDQDRELARVESRLALAIIAWCEANRGRTFHLAEPTNTIAMQIECAPDSVRRVMAQLRKSGHVQVELLSRSDSLYRVAATGGGANVDT
jgi:hypothetical protein